MKKTLILIAAALISMGAVAQTKKAKKSKKVDPIMALYEKQKAEFEASYPEITKQMNDLNKAYYAAKSREEQEELSKTARPVFMKYMEVQKEYQEKNPSTIVTASFIAPYASRMSLEEAKAAYEKFSKEAKQSYWGKEMQKSIAARENTLPGKPAPLIAKNDINGNPFSLADLKGKVVLLDFWATWCVPCRKSNPHMMRIYDKYRKHGLEFVYVADDDRNEAALKVAIEKDGVGRDGIHHVLRGLKEVKDENGNRTFDRSEDVSDLYDVHSIPTKFLIGKDGNIIGKVESEKWLDEQLSQIFLGKPNRDFHLEGTIDGCEGDTINLHYSGADDKPVMASCKIENGKFHFDGTLGASFDQAALMVGNPTHIARNTKYCHFYLEPSENEVALKVDDFQHPMVMGSDTQSELMAFNQTIKAENDKMDELNKKFDAAQSAEEHDAIRAEMAPISAKISKAQMDYIKAHPQSNLNMEFIFWNMSDMKYEDLKSAYNNLNAEQKASQRGRMIEEELKTKEVTQPGCEAFVIKKNDVMTGKPFDMSKLRGKYVVIDFWATWCVPCRKSNPHMLELYKKYNKKGLEFIFVADDDRNEAGLKKAIQQDGLQKMHHVLRGLQRVPGTHDYDKSNDISDKYGVHSLPTKYLIDKEGKIVGIFDSEELDKKLEELLGK